MAHVRQDKVERIGIFGTARKPTRCRPRAVALQQIGRPENTLPFQSAQRLIAYRDINVLGVVVSRFTGRHRSQRGVRCIKQQDTTGAAGMRQELLEHHGG